MNKLRVAVIGCGYLGRFHAEKYARMDNVELVGIVDTDYALAEEMAQALATSAYDSHRQVLDKVDAVSVVVPTLHHYAVAKDFLYHDVDVLIEKPMTTTLEEADELIGIAEERGAIIQVGHLERFNPAVVALKDILNRPRFIESHRLSSFKGRGTDVSVVLDLMIHDIDIILNFVRSDVQSIHAAGMPVICDQVDIANARLEFENGCVANVTASRISTKNQRKIRLFQKDAYVSVDFADCGITLIHPAKNENSVNTEILGKGMESDLIPGMMIHQHQFSKTDALKDELRAFVHSAIHRETTEVTGQMGRDALKIALSVMDQIKKGEKRLRA